MANTSRGVLFLPPSDAYVRSFLYLLYTWIKLYFTKALSNQASSLAPDWILLLQRPRISVFSYVSNNLSPGASSRILQDKVRMLGALVLCSPSKHVFCCTLLTLRYACVDEWKALSEASEEPCSAVPWWSHTAYARKLPVGSLYRPANVKRHPMSPSGTDQKWAKSVDRTLLSQSDFLVSLTIS